MPHPLFSETFICLWEGLNFLLMISFMNCSLNHWHRWAPQFSRKSWVDLEVPVWDIQHMHGAVLPARLSSPGLMGWPGGRKVALLVPSIPLPVPLLGLGNWWREYIFQREQDKRHHQKLRNILLDGVSHIPGTLPGFGKVTMANQVLPSWAYISWEGQPKTKDRTLD